MRKDGALEALFPGVRQSILLAVVLQAVRWWYLSDLAKHLGCRHLTTLDKAAAVGDLEPPTWRDSALEVLQQRGFEHEASFRARIVGMVYAFRALGHTAAWIDPLSDGPPAQPALDPRELGFSTADLDKEVATTFFLGGKPMKLRDMMQMLRTTYCDRIGFEFMHIHNMEVRNWIRDRIESRVRSAKTNSSDDDWTWSICRIMLKLPRCVNHDRSPRPPRRAPDDAQLSSTQSPQGMTIHG